MTGWAIAAVALLTVGWPTAASPQELTTAAPHRLVVLDPVTDLVHDDLIRVQVTGLPAGGSVALAQCEPGGVSLDDNCDGYAFLRADPWGVARARMEADVILDTAEGPVDCRTVTCRIVTLFAGDGVTRRANLHYDPAGPDPERPVVQVTPTTDLVDGQTVQVTADPIPLDLIESRRVWIRQCVLPASHLEHCDEEELSVAPSPAAVNVTFDVEALLQPWGESHDCRAGDCVLWVGSRREGSQSALIPLDFDPLGPIPEPPSITVTPSADLDDGQQVAVDGEGFDDGFLSVRQCPASSTEDQDCDLTVRAGPDTFDGTFHTDVSVRAVLRTENGPGPDCRVEACILAVSGFHGPPATAPLTFDPSTQVLEPEVSLVDGTGLGEIESVEILGSGYPEGPNRITFYQCVGAPSPERVATHCWRGVRLDRTIEDTFDLTYTVRRRMRAPAVGIVDCRIYRCKVWVAELGNAGVVATARLRFD